MGFRHFKKYHRVDLVLFNNFLLIKKCNSAVTAILRSAVCLKLKLIYLHGCIPNIIKTWITLKKRKLLCFLLQTQWKWLHNHICMFQSKPVSLQPSISNFRHGAVLFWKGVGNIRRYLAMNWSLKRKVCGISTRWESSKINGWKILKITHVFTNMHYY
jgi:hypothetical protein